MKWIQHQSNSRHDVKLQRLVRKHGATGYGVYWMVVETIAEKLDDNLDCVLEHDIEDLADEFYLDKVMLKTILDDCVTYKLLTLVENHYQCLKVLKYMDEWTRKKISLRSKSGVTPDVLGRHSGELQPEVKRREGKGREEKEEKLHTVAQPTVSEKTLLDKAQAEFLRLKSKHTPPKAKAFNPTAIIEAIQSKTVDF